MTAPDFRTRLAAARALMAHGWTPPPTNIRDQLGAAAKDVRAAHAALGQVLPLIDPSRGWRERMDTAPSDDVRAYLVAAMLGCIDVCSHLRRGGPQPSYLRLALRRADCGRCVQTMRLPPPDEEDRCDLCGARDIVTFVPFATRSGPALLVGDACTDCAAVLGLTQMEAAS